MNFLAKMSIKCLEESGVRFSHLQCHVFVFVIQDMANKVLEIFSAAEPAQLPHVVSSPSMLRVDPDGAMIHLKQLEVSGTSSITLSLCMASLALRKGDLHSYRQQMDRHAEVISTVLKLNVYCCTGSRE